MSTDVGEVWRTDGNGRRHLCLVSSDGTRAAAEGRDFASVIRRLPLDRLDFWLTRFARTCPHERRLLEEEIGRRDPRGARGTLWEHANR